MPKVAMGVALALFLTAAVAGGDENAALSVRSAGRTSFLRMEEGAAVEVEIRNQGAERLGGGSVRLSLSGGEEVEAELPPLAPDQAHTVAYPMDTRLRPGNYGLLVEANAAAGPVRHSVRTTVPVVLAPRPLPHAMPVFLWGRTSLDYLDHFGFTHQHGIHPSFRPIWRASEPLREPPSEGFANMLDNALARGKRVTIRARAMLWALREDRAGSDYQRHMERVDREGNPYRHRHLCGQHERLRQYCYIAGASLGYTYRDFPAAAWVDVQNETRDHSEVCFCDLCRAAYREHSGQEFPEEVRDKRGMHYDDLEGFPVSRVVPDDHPLLRFYRWFWTEGDGWDRLNTAVHEGFRATGRDGLQTFFAPATRGPSYYGSGGDVDILLQWTYAHPDPTRVGLTADEVLALASPPGRPSKQAYQMTQLFTKRSYIMPRSRRGEPFWDAEDAPFLDADPDAGYLTITPDQLRGAFWSKVSRPVDGIAFHGFPSLVPIQRGGGYRFTHPHTQDALRELVRDVVQPFGATLTQVPDPPKDVAFLQSFTSQMLARRGAFGWGFRGWETDAYMVLLHAQLQPEIIYDEAVTERGLDGYKVLAMFHCDVLTESVAEAVREFQRNDGIVIGDEFLAPAITPDILVRSARRSFVAQEGREMILGKAAELREQLDAVYERVLDSSEPDVLVRLRRYGSADYVFAFNDRREYGDYLGHHRWVMEKGVDAGATVSLRREGGTVYDLLARRRVDATWENGLMQWDVRLGPGEGRLFMVVDRPVAEVKLDVPDAASLGEPLTVRATVLDDQGNPVNAVVPVEVVIRDRLGRDAEFAGYHGAKGGTLEIPVELAPNDEPGVWWVSVRELATGRRAGRIVDVE